MEGKEKERSSEGNNSASAGRESSAPIALRIDTQNGSDREVGGESESDNGLAIASSWLKSYARSLDYFSPLQVANNFDLKHTHNNEEDDINEFESSPVSSDFATADPIVSANGEDGSNEFDYQDMFEYNLQHSSQSVIFGNVDGIPGQPPVVEGSSMPEGEAVGDVHTFESSASQSSLPQTIFNMVNVFLGLGILALPYAFKLDGWVFGIGLILLCGLMTKITALMLIECMKTKEYIKSYSDIGNEAFGSNGKLFITIIFFLELFMATCANMVLIGDNLHVLFPEVSLTSLKLIAFAVILPTCLPGRLSLLSYASLVGIIGSVFLYGVIFYDGLSKPSAPGSLIDPLPTFAFPPNWLLLPNSFGIIMFSFSGHAIFPNLYMDMRSKHKFNHAVNVSYTVAVSLFIILASAGFLMFGKNVLQEITFNVAREPFYNVYLSKVLVWLIVINPTSKYALMLNPLSSFIESFALRGSNGGSDASPAAKLLIRSGTCAFTVLVAILFPDFEKMLAIVGSLCSISVCTIFPTACYIKIFHDRQKKSSGERQSLLPHHLSSLSRGPRYSLWVAWIILFVSIAMGISGTIWPFIFPSTSTSFSS